MRDGRSVCRITQAHPARSVRKTSCGVVQRSLHGTFELLASVIRSASHRYVLGSIAFLLSPAFVRASVVLLFFILSCRNKTIWRQYRK